MRNCPCGTGKSYLDCCGVFIHGEKKASTPEALMRSRYCAYALGNMDYIAHTMKGAAKARFDARQINSPSKSLEWVKLKVKSSSIEGSKGFVEFIAYFKEKNKIHALHELSEFHRQEGEWYYVDGKFMTKKKGASQSSLRRNDMCYCGSGKKYKHCCLLSF